MRGVSVDYSTSETAINSITDILYKCTSANWDLLRETFSNISSTLITTTQTAAENFNSFLGVSIVYSPKNLISTSFHEGQYWVIAIAILIPVISAATQFLNIRLMPSAANSGQSNMGGSLKIMNYMMPIYSFILVFFLPVGVGVYWITGAIVRSVQQFLINRHLEKQDLDEMIRKNREKAEAKRKKRIEKKGVAGSQIAEAAKINTRQISNSNGQVRRDSMAAKANSVKNTQGGNKNSNKGKNKSNKKSDAAELNATENTVEEAPVKLKENSLAAKANLVRDFNNKNTRK
jgi:YidC/Oxa1 family membrane protein insertase